MTGREMTRNYGLQTEARDEGFAEVALWREAGLDGVAGRSSVGSDGSARRMNCKAVSGEVEVVLPLLPDPGDETRDRGLRPVGVDKAKDGRCAVDAVGSGVFGGAGGGNRLTESGAA